MTALTIARLVGIALIAPFALSHVIGVIALAALAASSALCGRAL